MPAKPARDRLEIDQDLDFQRREWRAERIGWCAFALFVAAALAGLLGPGPLSEASARTPDGRLRADYERFVHYGTQTSLRLRAEPRDARELRVWLADDVLERARIERVEPEPDAVLAAAGRHVYVFAVAAGGGPVDVTFELHPEWIGRLESRLGLEGGPELALAQLAFP
jgi:hypothetical protein